MTVALSLGVVAPAAADPRLGFEGLGPVDLGMTVEQALDTGAMAHDRAVCPGEDVDFIAEYGARALWGSSSTVIAIQAQRSIRGRQGRVQGQESAEEVSGRTIPGSGDLRVRQGLRGRSPGCIPAVRAPGSHRPPDHPDKGFRVPRRGVDLLKR